MYQKEEIIKYDNASTLTEKRTILYHMFKGSDFHPYNTKGNQIIFHYKNYIIITEKRPFGEFIHLLFNEKGILLNRNKNLLKLLNNE